MGIRLKQLDPDGASDGQGLKYDNATGEWTPALKGNMSGGAAPTTTDDSSAGYEVGSVWVDTTNNRSYICVDDTASAAVWAENSPSDVAYGELYSTTPAQAITVVTAGVYYRWTDSIAGDASGGSLVTVSATTDDITIGADGGGVYKVHWDCSLDGPNNSVIDVAVHINNSVQTDSQGRVQMSAANAEQMLSGDAIMQLSSGDTVDLRLTSDGNGDVINICFVNMHVVRLGGSLAGGGTGDTLPVPDSIAIAKGSSDDTKQVRFEVDGITSGLTRVITVPDQDLTLVDTADSRLSDARTPLSHASSHQHGGSDEVATATPGVNAIPKADGTGTLADGWLPASIARDSELPVAATESVAGIAELATQAETDTGTDDTRIVTPLKLATTPLAGRDTDAVHDNVAGEIAAVTEKVSPVGADLLLIEDSAAGNAKKRVQISNLPGGGGGDNISVNATAATDANFSNTTPAAPAGEVNVKWQKDATGPDNISASVQTSNETQKGVIELATQAETDTGTDDTRAVTPLKLATTPLAGRDTDAIHDNVAGEITAVTEKVTPAAADVVLIEDSADANNKKRVQIGNIGGGTGPGTNMKAGEVLAGSFTGNPKTANVTFSTAYGNTNYAIALSSESGGSNFSPVIQNKATTGFTINLSTNNLGSLVRVTWTTSPYGEA